MFNNRFHNEIRPKPEQVYRTTHDLDRILKLERISESFERPVNYETWSKYDVPTAVDHINEFKAYGHCCDLERLSYNYWKKPDKTAYPLARIFTEKKYVMKKLGDALAYQEEKRKIPVKTSSEYGRYVNRLYDLPPLPVSTNIQKEFYRLNGINDLPPIDKRYQRSILNSKNCNFY
ncbi:hypothetical protein SNEBB_011323 [Seison nebaliae]|nr:hypothetical protein SNEBB_011323 [Seison nebaliae]